MYRKTQGEPLRPDHAFAFCWASFLMTFAMGRIPHAGSWQDIRDEGSIPGREDPTEEEMVTHSSILV